MTTGTPTAVCEVPQLAPAPELEDEHPVSTAPNATVQSKAKIRVTR
jgi:hypothetical protein